MLSYLLKRSFHTELCQRLADDIQFGRTNYFYFLGRPAEWNSTDTPPIEILDTNFVESSTRSELVSFKRISPSDVSLTVRRINWVSGIIYTQYDSTIDYTSGDFYVLTNDFNVYKCLDNNLGAPSTVKPTGFPISPIRTADGYLWKYMYSIAPIKRSKFLTSTKMPVQKSLTDKFYTNGSISNVVINYSGAGYDENTTVITVSGDGVGADFTPVVVEGEIVDIIVNSVGSGYTYAVISAEGPHDSLKDATLTAVLSSSNSDLISDQSYIEQTAVSGAIYNVVSTSGGTNYTQGVTTATLVGDGTGAIISPNISQGSIVSYTVINFGSGYTYANIVLSTDNLDIDPNSEIAEAYAIISPQNGHGSDAVLELNSNSICLFSNIRYSDQTQALIQEYREYGIIKNIRNPSDNSLVNTDFGYFTYSVRFNNISNLVKDEILTNGSAKYRVIDFNTQTSDVILSSITNNQLLAVTVLKAETDVLREYTVSNITNPVANKYSGQMMFVSDSDSFTFTDEQEITIKTQITI